MTVLGPSLASFLRVAELGSVSQAARALHLTQPAVSKQLRALEAVLGARLLERSGRGVQLTAAGVLVADYGRRSSALLDECRHALAQLGADDGGRLHLAAGPTTCIFQLPGWLRALRAERPRADIAVRTGTSKVVAEWVLAREAELGLVTSRGTHPELEQHVLFEEPIALVVAADAGKVTTLDALGLILFPTSTGFREYLDRQLDADRLRRLVKMETDSVEVIKAFVISGLGASFLPRSAIAAELADGGLRRVALRGLPVLRRSTSLVRRRDRALSPIALRFIAIASRLSRRRDAARAMDVRSGVPAAGS